MRLGTPASLKTLALALGCVLASHALAQAAPAPGTTPLAPAPAILSDPTGVENFPAKPSAPTGTTQPTAPPILSDPTGVEHFPAKPAAPRPGDAKGPKNLPHGSAHAKGKAHGRATAAAAVAESGPPTTASPAAATK